MVEPIVPNDPQAVEHEAPRAQIVKAAGQTESEQGGLRGGLREGDCEGEGGLRGQEHYSPPISRRTAEARAYPKLRLLAFFLVLSEPWGIVLLSS